VLINDCFVVNFRIAEGIELLGNQDCQTVLQLEQAIMRPSMVRTMEQMLSLLDGESQRPKQSPNLWSLNNNILVIVEQEQSGKLAKCSYASFNFGGIKGDHYIIHSKLQTAHMLPSPFWVASMEIIISSVHVEENVLVAQSFSLVIYLCRDAHM
jgi:hypothetical protein